MAQQTSLDSNHQLAQWLISRGLDDMTHKLTGMTLDRLLGLSECDIRTICVVLELDSQQIERLISAVKHRNTHYTSPPETSFYLTIYQQLITMGFDDSIALEASKNCGDVEESIQYISQLKNKNHPKAHGHELEEKTPPNQIFNTQNTQNTQNPSKESQKDEENLIQSMLTCTPDEVVTPQIPIKPKKDCRASFTGLVVSDTFMNYHTSVVYKIDAFSEYVGAGSYPKNSKAFPKAVASTFDGIAIDRNTRVIIWEKENFEGKILLDQVGPAIINNVLWKNQGSKYPQYVGAMSKTFNDPELQKNFPQHVRHWSVSNMHAWSHGSVKIVGADSTD